MHPSTSTAVQRVHRPTVDDMHTFQRLNRPVLITGAMDDWEALSTWSLPHLVERCGDQTLEVEHYPSGDRFQPWQVVEMSVADYVDKLKGPDVTHWYLAGHDIEQSFSPLVPEIRRPDFVPADPNQRQTVTFIGVDSVTAYHYHQANESVLCQVVGKKRLVLHPPSASHRMYPHPWWGLRRYNFSRVAPESPTCATDFPRYQGIDTVECEIGPGEMLFIPIQWWHAVYGEGLAMSVTYFWKTPLKTWQWRPPAQGLRDFANRGLSKAMTQVEQLTRGHRFRAPFYRTAERVGIVDDAEFYLR